MEGSEYAFAQGIRCTRTTLAAWRANPRPVLRSWLLGALTAAGLLLGAVLAVAFISSASPSWPPIEPPFRVGNLDDVAHIVIANGLVLALHAMACVAGFIAGSSLPLQAGQYTGRMRMLHERGPTVAIAFVVCATAFSLSMQAYTIGRATNLGHRGARGADAGRGGVGGVRRAPRAGRTARGAQLTVLDTLPACPTWEG